MRIITGKAKGLKLLAPVGTDVRPTADRVKESLFNILGTKVFDAVVLDLFSGSGNLALECWSRGAKKVICVENSEGSIGFIRKNIQKAKADNVTIYRNDAVKSIKRFYSEQQLFDLIFCDPPYDKGFAKSILTELAKNNILNDNGIFVLECSKTEVFDVPEQLELFRAESYGATSIYLLRRKTFEGEECEDSDLSR